MKKILLFLVTSLLSLDSTYSNEYIDINDNSKHSISYNCDSIIFNQDSNKLILLGNVNFQAKNYINVKAEKLHWDMNQQKICAYNVNSFQIYGNLTADHNISEINYLEYAIGDSVAYVK